MVNHTEPSLSDYGMPSTAGFGLSAKERFELLELFVQLARSDWTGEATFLLAVIGLLNTRNGTETQDSVYGKLNKARVKRGERPLFEHKVLRIHLHQRRCVPAGEGDRLRWMRGHFVRGHFKHRETGIY